MMEIGVICTDKRLMFDVWLGFVRLGFEASEARQIPTSSKSLPRWH